MKDVKQILAAVVAVCVLSIGALAFDVQRNDPKPPPPKDKKAIVKEDKQPPPQQSPRDERGRGNDNRREKP